MLEVKRFNWTAETHLVILGPEKSFFDLNRFQVHLLRLLVPLHGLVEAAEVAVVFCRLDVALSE